jgi:triacylglycerol esterase/lipase EstA (alpha/beta hydrolase family)
MTVRRFIEGVLEYTRANKVIVIGHSMGVTLARAAIIGGTY